MTHRLGTGFTLLEAIVVVAIIATLAAISLPSYANYVRRGRILEAVARLADARARMEEYFLDQRAYVDPAGRCGALPPPPGSADAFTVTCEATATTFTYTATGVAAKGMAAFTYSIDQTGAKATVSLPAGWSRTADCWTIRADGLCV
ncbi:MAG TPA: type IV pilin protein [Casimicrobiaceae bacterium]